MSDDSAAIVAALRARRSTIAVAESLTGGLLVSELISHPGASEVVLGGVVTYATVLKRAMLGVSAEVLARHGAVHPDVALQMASGVRDMFAVDGFPARIGIATTGVAGPGPEAGQPAGTAFVGVAIGGDVRFTALRLSGSRDEIRRGVVDAALRELGVRLGLPGSAGGE